MVYVGSLFRCLTHPHWPWEWAAHLEADTPRELGAFAMRLRLRRSWRQKPTTRHPWPHYDLTKNKRDEAVRAGAIEETNCETVARWQRWRDLAAGLLEEKP